MGYQFGDLFSEGLVRSIKRRNVLSDKVYGSSPSPVARFIFFVFILVFGLGILLIKLIDVTLVEGARYRRLSVGNRIKEVKITAPRGIIYDRQVQALVRNIPTFILPGKETFFENKPVSISGELIESVAREYVDKDLYAHLIGYTGEISKEELDANNSEEGSKIKYVIGDIVGKMGIEKAYDWQLKGIDGKQMYEVDALGNIIRVLGRIEPVAGKNITLSIDAELQKLAKEEMTGRKGAVVATDPKTGEIMVYYSSPSFDPNKFVRGGDINEYLADPDQPLFDRVITGQYPPGSTFKIVSAIAALETGTIDSKTQIEDIGILKVGDFSFGNWYFNQYGRKEGFLNIVGAIRRSNDIFFYKLGEMVGITKIAEWAGKLGIGRKLGIDLPGEAEGLMPDPEWRKRVKGEDWYLGNTYHIAIGQGDILMTPLQVNALTNVIADNGQLCKPKLLLTGNIFSQKDSQCEKLGISSETIKIVKEGMKEACQTGGTAWPLFNFKIENSRLGIDGVNFLESFESTMSARKMVEVVTACKTGTSEFGDPKGKTHAWFTIFAPVSDPQISVTVLVEGGGEGSSVAAPIAKKILEAWFKR